MASLVVMVTAFGALGARVIHVQGLAADRYVDFGENQRIRRVALPAYRGSIFDRNGNDLALSVRQSSVTANPRRVEDPLAAAKVLAPLLDREAAELQDRLTRDQAFVYLARTVDDAVADRVQALAIAGVELREEPKRFLPAGTLALPVLGRVGTENKGLSGLEVQFDEALAGRPGTMVVERDPNGREISGGVRDITPAARGDDLVLSVDRALQYEAERSLSEAIVTANAQGGMAILMQTATGEVLALANLAVPAEGGPPVAATKNMALTNVFEPGSVNKMITIAGAIEDKVIGAADSLIVPPKLKVADKVFEELTPHPAARWSVTEVIANSSNVGTIKIGQLLGKDRIDHYLRAFGFGSRTGLGFPGESGGILLNPKRWSGTSIGTVSIGQGLAVTGMQMLAAFNAMANGGTYVAPKLVKATVDAEGRRTPTSAPEPRAVVSTATAQQVTAMLAEVVRVGTGVNAAIPGYTVAGKTGTARKPLEGARGYEQGAYVASFAGFAPAEKPALSAIVILDEPTPIYGGTVAAPVFSKLVGYALRHLGIAPPGTGLPPAAAVVPKAAPENVRPVGEISEPVDAVPPSTPVTTIAPAPGH